MNAEQLKMEAAAIEVGLAGEFDAINTYIYEHPEVGLKEYVSSQYLADYLSGKGFSVQKPFISFDTAFRADYGSGDMTVAFLAEYDALPGYGPDKVNGHACGHNWIASTAVGAGVVLSRLADKLGIRVSVIGTPAEENFCAKVAMVKAGVFDDIDVCMQAHLSAETSVCGAALAMNSLEFDFFGKAAHSAGAPWDGINALDAVYLMFSGINALRQHVRPDVRIHGIITDGGFAANIVPDKASCLFYVRSASRGYLDTLLPKVENIAKGAALMTGAKLEIGHPELPLDDLINLPVLQKLASDNFTANGIVPTGTVEKARRAAGSTDIGSVSHVCPTAYVEVAPEGDTFKGHEESALCIVDSPEAHKAMHSTIRAFAGMALDIALDRSTIERARTELALAAVE